MRAAACLFPFVLAVLGAVAEAASPLSEVAVTTCGQILPPRTLGYLTGDLDCSGWTGGDPDVVYDTATAVSVGFKGKLDLRGYTITASTFGVQCDNVRTSRKRRGFCEVFNGTVVGAVQRGIAGAMLYAHDVTTTGNGVGLYVFGQKGRIEDAVVTGNSDDGIRVGNTTLARVTVSGNGGHGVVAYSGSFKIVDSTVDGNAIGAYCSDPSANCADLTSRKRPKVSNTTCGTSAGSGDGSPATWGLCGGD